MAIAMQLARRSGLIYNSFGSLTILGCLISYTLMSQPSHPTNVSGSIKVFSTGACKHHSFGPSQNSATPWAL